MRRDATRCGISAEGGDGASVVVLDGCRYPAFVMTQSSPSVRRAARAAALVGPLLTVALATPALAAVPEGWSDPAPVSAAHALLIWVVLPLVVFMVVLLLASIPTLLASARSAPSVTTPAPDPEPSGLDELLGGHDEAPALEASEDTDR
jgi:hypothetical protein